jgi:LmbE family N-acetylglucosaminyl deacetylase
MFPSAIATLTTFALFAPVALTGPDLSLRDDDRILILAPHPDDETLGCAGILQEAVRRELAVRVVFATYGDSNQWSFLAWNKRPTVRPSSARAMGARRRTEALAALAVLGVPAESVAFLGYPDYGTMAMWLSRWNDRPAARGRITRARSVPYDTAFRPGALYKGDEMLADLRSIIAAFKPTQVFVSHAADHHPDHGALYLYTRVALWNLEATVAPALHPFLVHFPRWPLPKGFRTDSTLEPPARLRDSVDWSTYRLEDAAVALKKTALQQHKTQYRYSAARLLPFVRRNESFGDFPAVRLARGGVAGFGDLEKEPEEGLSLGDAPPEVLAKAARTFVGIEGATLRLENGRLTVDVEFDRPLSAETEAAVYLFGYRHDMPFPLMPKLAVRVTPNASAVSNNGHRLASRTVVITRRPKGFQISLALAALGTPERMFVGQRTWADPYVLDIVPWRIVELP